jgi:hypothetical protein
VRARSLFARIERERPSRPSTHPSVRRFISFH